jgi:protein phosphatase
LASKIEAHMEDGLLVPRLSLGFALDIGTVRSHQEDCIGLADLYDDGACWAWAREKGNLYVLADGAGGHEAGEVASTMAVLGILNAYYRDRSTDLEAALVSAIRRAGYQIGEQALASGTGARTTVACAAVHGRQLYTASVGDSRVYLVRGGQIAQLGEDHSLVAQWVREHKITAEQARTHPYRNVITQALGGPEEVHPSLHWEEILPGDTIVLCSDGLHGLVDDDTIAHVVSLETDPRAASDQLVDLANFAGGLDNISVIVVYVEGFGPGPREEQEIASGGAGSLAIVQRSDGIVYASTDGPASSAKRDGKGFIERLSAFVERRATPRDADSS